MNDNDVTILLSSLFLFLPSQLHVRCILPFVASTTKVTYLEIVDGLILDGLNSWVFEFRFGIDATWDNF